MPAGGSFVGYGAAVRRSHLLVLFLFLSYRVFEVMRPCRITQMCFTSKPSRSTGSSLHILPNRNHQRSMGSVISYQTHVRRHLCNCGE